MRKYTDIERRIRTENLKKDYAVYCIVAKRNGAPERTWEQWAKWVWEGQQQSKTSVFRGMSFGEFVEI